MSELSAEAIERIGELAVDASDVHQEPFEVARDAPVYARTVAANRRLEVGSLERFLPEPLRPRGTAMLHDPTNFADYTNRLATEQTSVWAHEPCASIVAVFNDHGNPERPGWRDHLAELSLQTDPDWTLWTDMDGHLGTQEWFAEHIEDTAHTVTNPDAATMHTIARTFKAHTTAAFDRATRLESGDVSLVYKEETTAKAGNGKIEVPERFEVTVAPFVGAEPVSLIARLRYRIRDGDLRIGYKLLRPDEARRRAFIQVVDAVTERLHEQVPVLYGAPPGVVAATP